VRDCLGQTFRLGNFVYDPLGIGHALRIGNHNPSAAHDYHLRSELTKAAGPADDHSGLIRELTVPHHRG